MTQLSRQVARIPPRMKIASLAIMGGLVVILGAWLPWFSLFAGLQPYRGVELLNGQWLLGGGAFSTAAGAWFLRHSGVKLRWGIGLFGFALLAFAAWSLLQLLFIFRGLSTDPLMVAGLGPGLFVVIGGAALIFATLFVEYSAHQRSEHVRALDREDRIPESENGCLIERERPCDGI